MIRGMVLIAVTFWLLGVLLLVIAATSGATIPAWTVVACCAGSAAVGWAARPLRRREPRLSSPEAGLWAGLWRDPFYLGLPVLDVTSEGGAGYNETYQTRDYAR